MQQVDSPTTLTLNDVKQHFDHWRATRIKQTKIPDSLRYIAARAGKDLLFLHSM